MQRLIINNFGPISHVDLSFDTKINTIIGPQASGKSTLAKTIYFCRKIKDFLSEYALNWDNSTPINGVKHDTILSCHRNELYTTFTKYLRWKFMGCFGTTKHLNPFEIMYYYKDSSEPSYVKLSLDDKHYVRFEFSNKLKTDITETLHYIRDAHDSEEEVRKEVSLSIYEELGEQYEQRLRRELYPKIDSLKDRLFSDSSDTLYIPAGRSILSTYSESLASLEVSQMDLPMQDFINKIKKYKTRYSVGLEEFVENYTKVVSGQIKNSDVDLAIQIVRRILKGEYTCERDGEKIYYSKDSWVKLMYSSSGQQESLWILMTLFSFIIDKRNTFVILEEPEAHLFPAAQKAIMELIALFSNSTGSSVVLTTHSPYILTSMNLLIYSHKIENNPKCTGEQVIVPKQCRLNPKAVSANIIDIDQASLRSIMKDDFVNAEEIDEVSQTISNDIDKIIEMEVRHDL